MAAAAMAAVAVVVVAVVVAAAVDEGASDVITPGLGAWYAADADLACICSRNKRTGSCLCHRPYTGLDDHHHPDRLHYAALQGDLQGH